MNDASHDPSFDIAVVAMAGRFPGADTVEALWRHLVDGRDLVTDISPDAYTAAGGDPDLLDDPFLVLAEAAIEGIDLFDADFFGYPAAEARLLDPQQRLFLECAVHTLEEAGYDPARRPGAVGVYAGSGQGDYHTAWVHPHLAGAPESGEVFAAAVANLVSSLPTRVAYHLGLTGPAVAVQTACSTSLVAVHTACQDLLAHRCDTALAGGASLNPLPHRGYRYTEGGLLSPDGRCRPFSADAAGMAGGDGVAAVLLRRLTDALADGDPIRAVIRGSAVNNDGARKVGFTAPSVVGQAEAVADALAVADVDPATVGYVEAHGTGTPVGDPIEVTALTRAFGGDVPPGGCVIGSVKGNIGHTDTAAGVIGLIKAVLCVERGVIPASPHAERTNPEIDFETGPFRVASRSMDWDAGRHPRRAGVSSFGIGGTNAHVVLEQPPAPTARGPEPPASVVVLSAKTPEALDERLDRLREHLSAGRDEDRDPGGSAALAEVAHTTQTGHVPYRHRWTLAARDLPSLTEALANGGGARAAATRTDRDLAWMFPGAGSQYPAMARGLHAGHPVFAREMERAARWSARTAVDLDAAVEGRGDEAAAFCAVVAVENALAAQLGAWGVAPAALIGHSLGEYTAAVVAGVLSLEDALTVVAERGRLLERAGGASLMVPLAEERVLDLLAETPGRDLDLAAVNGAESCVVSGSADRVAALADHLESRGLPARRLRVATAVHSRLLDPVLEDYRRVLEKVEFHPPRVAVVANPTGRPLTAREATDPDYWVRQMRETVRFADGIARLRADHDDPVLVEVGPGTALSALARDAGADAVPAMRHATADRADPEVVVEAVGRAWTHGARVDWERLSPEPAPRRIALPGYPFQRNRHWMPSPGPPSRGGYLVPDGLTDAGFATAQALARESAELVLTHADPVAPATAPTLSASDIATLHHAESQRGAPPPETGLVTAAPAGPTPPENSADSALDLLAAHHVLAALARAGVPAGLSEEATAAEIDALLEVRAPYQRLTAALLDLLTTQGLVERPHGRVRVRETPDPERERARVLARHPEAEPDTDLIAHCARHLADVVAGRATGVEVLLPDGERGTHHAAEEHRAAGELESYRAIAVEVATRLAREAGGRGLRVLEIGGGRGFLTWPVAEALREWPAATYHFTDVGRSFVLEGQREAERRGLDLMRFGTLDASRDPSEQGYEAGGYDLVLAFNVLHAVPDLYSGVQHACSLLRPGGTALVLELASPPGHAVLTAGLFEGMWTFDDSRTGLPTAAPETWRAALAAAGCSDTAVRRLGHPGEHHALIVGRREEDPAARRLADLHKYGGRVTVLTAPAGTLPPTPQALTTVADPTAATTPVAEGTALPDASPRPDTTHFNRRPELDVAYAPPRDDVEERVTAIWAEVLGLDRVGARDDFFALGGESLLAMRAIARVADTLGVRVAVRDLFDDLTPERLARRVREHRGGAAPAPAPVRRRGRTARRAADGSLSEVAPPSDGAMPQGAAPASPRPGHRPGGGADPTGPSDEKGRQE